MSDLREVTKETFWAWVMKTPRNVHPSPRGSSRDRDGIWSAWHDQRTGQLVAKSFDKTGRYYLLEGNQ